MRDDDLAPFLEDYFRSGAAKEDTMYQIACEDPIIHTGDNPVCLDETCPCRTQVVEYMPAPWSEEMHEMAEAEWGKMDDAFIRPVEVQAEAKPLKYIRFGRNSWVHIASGEPFTLKAGRYGRWSKTLCGHLYERDDYDKVENVEYAERKLCKRCAQQKRLTLRGPDVDLGYERAVK